MCLCWNLPCPQPLGLAAVAPLQVHQGGHRELEHLLGGYQDVAQHALDQIAVRENAGIVGDRRVLLIAVAIGVDHRAFGGRYLRLDRPKLDMETRN